LHRSTFAAVPHEALPISETVKALKSLDDRLSAELHALEARVAHVRKQTALGQAILSPWRRVPPEILSAIFTLALPDEWEELFIDEKILPLAQVCHTWREVACRTSHLWTDFVIIYEGRPRPVLLEVFKTLLDRTGRRPLHLELTMYLEYVSNWDSDPLWAHVFEQSHRWETIFTKNLDSEVYTKHAHGRPYPNLRCLALDASDEDKEGYEYADRLDAFRDAPHLSVLRAPHYWLPSDYEIPSSWCLTVLDIKFDCPYSLAANNPSMFACILSCSRTLQKCTVWAVQPPEISHLRPVEFPVLEELDLGYGAICIMDNCMRAPNLRTLVLRNETSGPDDIPWSGRIPDLVGLFLYQSKAYGNLRSLELRDVRAIGIVPVLRRLEGLERLEIQDEGACPVQPNDSVAVAEALTRDEGDPYSMTLLPNLTHMMLVFSGMRRSAGDMHTLIQEVERSRSSEALRKIGGKRLACLDSSTNSKYYEKPY
ncbi:hypothetical protein HDZ31DRAFT_42794, partial [Schizophyllum fasciatum]